MQCGPGGALQVGVVPHVVAVLRAIRVADLVGGMGALMAEQTPAAADHVGLGEVMNCLLADEPGADGAVIAGVGGGHDGSTVKDGLAMG